MNFKFTKDSLFLIETYYWIINIWIWYFASWCFYKRITNETIVRLLPKRNRQSESFANFNLTNSNLLKLKLILFLPNAEYMNLILNRYMFCRRIINSIDLLKHILPKATFFPASVFSSNPKGTNHPLRHIRRWINLSIKDKKKVQLPFCQYVDLAWKKS